MARKRKSKSKAKNDRPAQFLRLDAADELSEPETIALKKPDKKVPQSIALASTKARAEKLSSQSIEILEQFWISIGT